MNRGVALFTPGPMSVPINARDASACALAFAARSALLPLPCGAGFLLEPIPASSFSADSRALVALWCSSRACSPRSDRHRRMRASPNCRQRIAGSPYRTAPRRIDAREGAHATSVHQRCLPEGFYRSCEVHEPYARESALALDLRDACSAGRVLSVGLLDWLLAICLCRNGNILVMGAKIEISTRNTPISVLSMS